MDKFLLKKRKVLGHADSEYDNVLREISIMKRLSHPNVLRLREVIDDENDRNLYLVLDLMEKGSVLEGKEETTPLPMNTARRYFRELISALEYVHSQRVCHRDVKPENLLVDAEGTIHLADFGVAVAFEGDNDFLANTAGTLAFMAPELCAEGGAHFSGRKADIWSAGVTLYCFVVGRCPFMAKTSARMFAIIVEQTVEIPSVLDRSLQHLLRRLLDKNPATRITLAKIKSHQWVTQKGAWPMQ
jgi:serine/threonine protein kinase